MDMIKNDLQFETNKSRAIPPIVQVCATLRYLASNSFQQVIGDTLNVHKSTICRCIWRVCKALANRLNYYVKFPVARELEKTKRKFFNIAQFPNIIGAIDGTHIRILAPNKDEDVFVNRKHFHSINAQMICDSDGLFTNCVVKWPGSTHDSRIFRNSEIYEYLEMNSIGHLIGDSGYPCKKFILTPYVNPGEDIKKIAYNNALPKSRVIIEQAFGRLKRRFSILHSEIRLSPEKACLITVCCIILQNIATLHKLDDFDEEENFDPYDFGDGIVFQADNTYPEYIVNNFF